MRSFVVDVDEADVELAADRLWQLGVRAVEERVGAPGCVELWTVVGDDEASIAAAAGALDPRWRWRTEECQTDWPATWRTHARPMPVGDRLVVVPAWTVPPLPSTDRIPILIEPGAAFGLGDHPTTAQCLEAVERGIAGRTAPSVLDVGCGTGVLAIAAAKLGAGRVRAIDVSTAAVEMAIANAARNGVADRVEVDATPATQLVGEYDLVVANLLAPALVALASDLRRLTAPRGCLVVSGVLDGAHDHVLDALAPMDVERTDTQDGWATVTLVHRRR